MTDFTQFLLNYGLLFLFVAVFVEQMGLPLPGYPWLLAAGALAAVGKISFTAALVCAMVAYLTADVFWFYMGRHFGLQILRLFCRISPEPDLCVQHKQNTFVKYGLRSVMISKFLPGLSQIIGPMAGMTGTRVSLFLSVDTLGSLLYGGTMLGLGYLFSRQIERITTVIVQAGGVMLFLLTGSILFYLTYKYWQRHHLLHGMWLGRITANELRQKLRAGESVVILDVSPHTVPPHVGALIPGVIHLTLDQLYHHFHEISHDQIIIVYCACPHKEARETRIALRLKHNGFTRVHPMSGEIKPRDDKIMTQDILTTQDQTVSVCSGF